MIEQIYINKLLSLLEEDYFPEDITSRIVEGYKVKAYVRSKDEGILAGNKFIIPLLQYLGSNIIEKSEDGNEVQKGDNLIIFEGKADVALSVERLVLNLLGKLSGIATATNKMVKIAKEVNPSVKIAGTRKTTPGLRPFEKYAIEVGGGDPHRYNLSSMILIKDNHLTIIGNLEKAVKMAKQISSFTQKIEIEVSNYEDAIRAYKAGVDAILLDNMSPKEIYPIVNELKGKVILEASGKITPENVKDYAKTNVDIISSGYITHSSKSLDFSMDVEAI
ncbi:carboxylating nicotinate-nucleotide diphosphorylase [Acidianus sulfidivorans JP7]|uniref:Nicotinate-nucleotide pyrophosphorylase [carboxylating] n=1 Tax=Acidianus sulfidivorans JP7 TaxID=619593 RepID=A0A2U9IK20_9CREN|nr:carboxylating nicotinate-nucleotide diphosphorylase [Acidianus sulfidivorans]AWR96389.1 carboxylating nicotinate-nucleotide diphosphorylase [Acidianus sulfidivorans JP7]